MGLISRLATGFLIVSSIGCGGAEAEDAALAADDPVERESVVTNTTKGVAEVERNGVVAVDAGYAADGVQIDIPEGFLSSECKFTAGLAHVEGSALSASASVSSTGVVACRKVVQEREDVPAETQGCVASYIVVCVDNE